MAKALPGLHAFTGSDCTSAFVRKGKIQPFKTLEKYPEFMPFFQNLGMECSDVNDFLFDGLQRFTCCLYGKPSFVNVNKVRCNIFRSRYDAKSPGESFSKQDGIDLSLLPPCKSSLRMHCLRANYQAFVWKHSHEPYPDITSPIGCGWMLDAEGKLAIDWISGDVMPQQLVDILEANESDLQNTTDEDDVEELVEEDDEIDNILDIIFEDDQD